MDYTVVFKNFEAGLVISDLVEKRKVFKIYLAGKIILAWGVLKVWSANSRSNKHYAWANSATYWQSDRATLKPAYGVPKEL